MNNWIKTALFSATALSASFSFSQDVKVKPNASQEQIIIRKKGDKTEKTTIVIDGEKVTVNGKPFDDFKDDDLSITRMKTPRPPAPPSRIRSFSLQAPDVFLKGDLALNGGNKAMLGVATEKADGGAKVLSVTDESAAANAGIKKDDIIKRVGDKKIEAPADLVAAIATHKPEDKVDIVYTRDGKENKTTATLKENKNRAMAFNFDDRNFNFDLPARPMSPSFEGSAFSWSRRPKIGMQIQDVEEGKGVTVKDIDDGSPAKKSGFKEGDIITNINGKEIAGVDELREQIKDLKEGDSLKVDYLRDGKKQSTEIKIPRRLKTADL